VLRTKLFGGLAAAGLAVAMAATGTVQPAQAAEAETRATGVQAAGPEFDWAGLVISVVGALLGGGGSSDAAIQAAVQQIKAAIEQAKTDIIRHTDLIAAAEVQACVRAATIEFTNIEVFSEPVLDSWAQTATSCATKATEYVNAVVSPQAADNIGYLIGPIFSIVLAARAKAGLVYGTDLVLAAQIRAYEGVIARDRPECTDRWQTWPDPVDTWYSEHTYTCTAFNGDQASWLEYWYGSNVDNPIDYTWVEEYPMRNTARPIAQEALPRLRGALP
jgi:hypothetical protein